MTKKDSVWSPDALIDDDFVKRIPFEDFETPTNGSDLGDIQKISRHETAFRKRAAGKSYRAIAREMWSDPDVARSLPDGYSEKQVRADVALYLNTLRGELQDTLLDVIELETQRLDAMVEALWPAILKGDTRSIDTALRVSERRAKLLGLDSAVKIDWRIELMGLIDSGFVTADEVLSEIGVDLYAQFTQFVEEQRNAASTRSSMYRNPLFEQTNDKHFQPGFARVSDAPDSRRSWDSTNKSGISTIAEDE